MEGRFVEMLARQLARRMEGASFSSSSTSSCLVRVCVDRWVPGMVVWPLRANSVVAGGGWEGEVQIRCNGFILFYLSGVVFVFLKAATSK